MRSARSLAFLMLAVSGGAIADSPIREIPLLNVELTDARGVTTRLSGFHLLNGEHRFQGYLGAAEIEVSYRRLRAIRISTPTQPGGRMRANLLLRSGKTVPATFDEREGEILMAGFASFGRLTFYFRDIRHLKILGETRREDLPAFGRGTGAVDVRLKDRHGVVTELTGFRRAAGEDVVSCLRGSATVTIPLRILKSLTLSQDPEANRLRCVAVMRSDGARVEFELPTYEERMLYRGEADFGGLRIRLAQVREIVIHRPTPRLRDLDPLEAVTGRAEPEKGEPPR